MCIAIMNKSSLLTFETIENSFENNSDGASITYIKNNQFHIHKEMKLSKVKDFYNIYSEARKITESPIMLHFRIGTSGGKNVENLHPFHVNKELVLCHNGIIDTPILDKSYNDSYHFAKFCRSLKKHNNLINNQSIEFLTLEKLISASNKVIFFHRNGKYAILNEDKGHYDKHENWFSNYTYESCNYYDIGGVKSYKTSLNNKSYSSYYSDSEEWIDNYEYNINYNQYDWFNKLGALGQLELIKSMISPNINQSDTDFLTEMFTYYEVDNLLDLYIELSEEYKL
jgi:predicted glutamine amidotransferase